MQVLPELKGILSTASGAQVTQVLQAVPDLQQAMRPDQVEDTLIPVMLKALGDGDTRLQEEVCLVPCDSWHQLAHVVLPLRQADAFSCQS